MGNSLSFKSINHSITCMDHQLVDNSTLLIIVIGMLKTDEDPPQSFSQTFVLKSSDGGSFYVKSDVFRMILHNTLLNFLTFEICKILFKNALRKNSFRTVVKKKIIKKKKKKKKKKRKKKKKKKKK